MEIKIVDVATAEKEMEELIDLVLQGERVWISVEGKPMAEILPYEETDNNT